jgi:hypothetical protein
MIKELKFQDLRSLYDDMTSSVRCECTISTKLVGGLPADRKALLAFAEHHLKIVDPQERENAVARMLKEEIGERNVTPETGEVNEKQVYGVNIVRHDEQGRPFLGNWMIKACLKQAASRVGLFTETRGTKGNMSEAGSVNAIGVSAQDPNHPEIIYLAQPDSEEPASTYFEEFMGRVQSPQGPVSIIHHSECVAPGSRFAFEFQFLRGGLDEDAIEKTLAMAMICGLGSIRSLECGKFRIDRCFVNMKEKTKKPEKEKKEKTAKPEATPLTPDENLQASPIRH